MHMHAMANGEQPWQESRDHAVQIRGGGAKGDEGVHVGSAVLQGRPQALIERPASPKLHGCRECEEPERMGQPRWHPGQHRAHGPDHHWQAESQAHQKTALQRPHFIHFNALLGGEVCVCWQLQGLVASTCDSLSQGACLNASRHIRHRGLLSREVDLGFHYAWHVPQGALNGRDAPGAVHPLDRNRHMFKADLIAAGLHGLHDLIKRQGGWLVVQRRCFCGQIDLSLLDTRQVLQHFFDAGYASSTMHTANGQIETLRFHWCSPCRPRDRPTTFMRRPQRTITLVQSLSMWERELLYTDDTRLLAVRQGHLMLSPGGVLRLWADKENDTQWRQGQFQ